MFLGIAKDGHMITAPFFEADGAPNPAFITHPCSTFAAVIVSARS